MNISVVNPAPPHVTTRRGSSLTSDGAIQPRPVRGDRSQPIRVSRGNVIPGMSTIAFIGLVLGVACSLPGQVQGSTHVNASALQERWPLASAMVGDSTKSVDEIAQAAKLDLAARRSIVKVHSADFARWVLSNLSNPEVRLDAKRGADIFQFFMSESGNGAPSFWSEFSLATFQKIAGEDLAVAGTLERALQHATTDDIPPEVIARTTGIMGHAQQAGGMLAEARRTFGDLENDPFERTHATIHLGEIALSTRSVEAGIEIWMNHPQGTTAAVTVIVEEADALWRLNPEQSYQLVAESLARLKPKVTPATPELLTAVSRLAARSRENAALSITEGAPDAIGEPIPK